MVRPPRSEPFSIGKNAGDFGGRKLSLGPSGGQHQTIVVKCFSPKCLRSMEMKKIEAIISSSRLSALVAELRGDGILAHLTTTQVQRDDRSDQPVSAKKNKREALRSWVKIELIVADQRAQRTAQMILRHAQPGLNAKGGQIIILDLIQSLQIVAPLLFAPSSLEEGLSKA
jgi:nitrogen regulatory protein PII